MKITFEQDVRRADQAVGRLTQHGWVEIDLGIPAPIGEDGDWFGWFDRISDAIMTVRPWMKQRNIDFRILHGNFFVRRRKATLVRLRWAGQF